jgi:(S)-mandelate dehydrogenase
MWPATRGYQTKGPLQRAVGIEDLRRRMHARLPGFVSEYIEGGADGEITLKRNIDAYQQATLHPRMLVDVSSVDARTEVMGTTLPLPLVVGPTGLNGFVTHEGDLKLAAAASAMGVPFTQSMVSMSTIEDVAEYLNVPHWMQLYVLRDRAFAEHLIDRALRAGCTALVLTVDGAVYGNRAWEKRCYARPAVLDLRSKCDVLAHPRWLADVYRTGHGPHFVNVETYLNASLSAPRMAQWLREQMDASLTWHDLAWLRERWPHKLIVKGLLALDDVHRAVDAGMDGVVISNHGGRQLDLAPAPLHCIAGAARITQGKAALFVDGGIRRGSDIVQALARGADAVWVGRAVLYGLAAGGQAGAARALAILHDEFVRTMALLGCRNVSEIDTRIFEP